MPNGTLTYEEEWMDVDDGGVRQVSVKEVTAKQQHVCNHCLGFIREGERYIRDVFVYENKIMTEKYHPRKTRCWEKYNGQD